MVLKRRVVSKKRSLVVANPGSLLSVFMVAKAAKETKEAESEKVKKRRVTGSVWDKLTREQKLDKINNMENDLSTRSELDATLIRIIKDARSAVKRKAPSNTVRLYLVLLDDALKEKRKKEAKKTK